MRTSLRRSLLLIFCLASAAAWAQAAPPQPQGTAHVPGEILVKFQQGALDEEGLDGEDQEFDLSSMVKDPALRVVLEAVAERKEGALRRVVAGLRPRHAESRARSGRMVSVPDLYNLMVLRVPAKGNVPALARLLSGYAGIEYAEPNYLLAPDAVPNDPNYGLQRGLDQPSDIDIDAEKAWDYSTGSSAIRVAIIDSGIDYHNPDLGSGVFGTPGAKVRGGWDYFSNDGNPDDEQLFADGRHSHGTKVAGIVGALRNNGVGVAGIAGGNGFGNNGVELFALKVGGVTGGYPTSDIVEAITEAATSTAQYGFGCHVINMSFGSYNFSESMRGALAGAMLNNVVLVASKGNDNSTSRHYPSDYDKAWMLSVGATDHEDKRASFSNYNNDIDFSAPGVTSLVHTTSRTEVANFSSFSGTSAAAPHVAGLAALLLSARSDLHPEEMQGILKATADRVRTDLYAYDSTGWNNQLGHGRINAGRALEVLSPPWSLTRHTVRGGASSNAGVSYDLPIPPIWGWGNPVYGYRTRVRNTVTFPSGYTAGPYVFGRGTNASEGWSSIEPVTTVDYCGVVSSTSSSAVIETYVYEVYEFDNVSGWEYGRGWFPTEPWNAVCAYSILGVATAPAAGGNPFTYANARDQYLACWGIAGRISSNCRDISDFNDKQLCYAMSDSIQSPCTSMTDRNLQLACYGMSVAPNYPSNCYDITDPVLKDFCYSVSSWGSWASCSGVSNPPDKALCQALTYRNSSYCAGISNANDRWFCYGASSRTNSYCANIVY